MFDSRLKTGLRRAGLTLAVAGALNWGAIGLGGTDLIARLFGAGSPVTLALYALVGAGGAFVVADALWPTPRPWAPIEGKLPS